MKLKLFISQLENGDMSQFPHLKEQIEGGDEKVKLIQDFFNFAEEEDSIWHL